MPALMLELMPELMLELIIELIDNARANREEAKGLVCHGGVMF